jgi:hypothetical protein
MSTMSDDGLVPADEASGPFAAIVEGQLRPPPDDHVVDYFVRRELLAAELPTDIADELQAASPGTLAFLSPLPDCDMCASSGQSPATARYDGPVNDGAWGYMCPDCFLLYGAPVLGTGRGQYLMTYDEVSDAVNAAVRHALETWRSRGVAVSVD